MNNDNRDSRPDAIDCLIADEEAAALAEFRTKDFPALVKQRIAEETPDGRRRRPSFLSLLERPAAIGAGVALVCGLIAFLVLPRGSSSGGAAAMIQKALFGMPGLQALDRTAVVDSEAAGVSGSASSDSFAAVLTTARKEIAAGERARTGSSPPGGKRRAPRLSLQEKYEILIIEKSIERVLTQLAKRFKEG